MSLGGKDDHVKEWHYKLKNCRTTEIKGKDDQVDKWHYIGTVKSYRKSKGRNDHVNEWHYKLYGHDRLMSQIRVE